MFLGKIGGFEVACEMFRFDRNEARNRPREEYNLGFPGKFPQIRSLGQCRLESVGGELSIVSLPEQWCSRL
jgi:hypothetical protein